jgi:hypothetical protein
MGAQRGPAWTRDSAEEETDAGYSRPAFGRKVQDF